jgi:hypothetical protein
MNVLSLLIPGEPWSPCLPSSPTADRGAASGGHGPFPDGMTPCSTPWGGREGPSAWG